MKDIAVLQFDPKAHYETVAGWWAAHMDRPIPLNFLPVIGFFVPETCAGFLYQTDSDFALIEGLISNPDSDSKFRDEALDMGVNWLMGRAKDIGFTGIQAFTKNLKVLARAERHGFSVSPNQFKLISRGL